MLRLPKKDVKALLAYQNAILSALQGKVNRIILFGSKARGQYNSNSDTDVLIVVDKRNKQLRHLVVNLTYEPILKYSVDISPIVMDSREFKEWSPFVEHIKKDGIELWNRKKKKSLLS